jgi:hypothetical protein
MKKVTMNEEQPLPLFSQETKLMYPETHAHLLHKLDLAFLTLFPVGILAMLVSFKNSPSVPLVSPFGITFVACFVVMIFKACIEISVMSGILPLRCHVPGCKCRVKMELVPAEGFSRVTRRYTCPKCDYVYEFTGLFVRWGDPDF